MCHIIIFKRIISITFVVFSLCCIMCAREIVTFVQIQFPAGRYAMVKDDIGSDITENRYLASSSATKQCDGQAVRCSASNQWAVILNPAWSTFMLTSFILSARRLAHFSQLSVLPENRDENRSKFVLVSSLSMFTVCQPISYCSIQSQKRICRFRK